jgi:hypothetical protein
MVIEANVTTSSTFHSMYKCNSKQTVELCCTKLRQFFKSHYTVTQQQQTCCNGGQREFMQSTLRALHLHECVFVYKPPLLVAAMQRATHAHRSRSRSSHATAPRTHHFCYCYCCYSTATVYCTQRTAAARETHTQ